MNLEIKKEDVMLGPSKLTALRRRFAKKVEGCVLDCGAGTGAYHHLFHTEDIVSLDLYASQLQGVRGKRVCANATQLPFKKDTFDVLWAFAFIQYIKVDLSEFIQEWWRVVKPGGKIVVLTPNGSSPFNPILRFFHLKDWTSYEWITKLYTAVELEQYGKVYGEAWFMPFLQRVLERHPRFGHTLLLEIRVGK